MPELIHGVYNMTVFISGRNIAFRHKFIEPLLVDSNEPRHGSMGGANIHLYGNGFNPDMPVTVMIGVTNEDENELVEIVGECEVLLVEKTHI